MATENYPKIASFKDIAAFKARLAELKLDLPCDDAVLSAAQGSPLARPIEIDGIRLPNRWCIHPMEGWDCTSTGEPTEHTIRRWQHFGASGAKLIWGGEAFAVQSDGRANPNQLGCVDDDWSRAEKGVGSLYRALGDPTDLLVGLQLTHSGRFCKPRDKTRFESHIAYHHPVLDAKFGIAPDAATIDDDYLRRLIDNYIRAAQMAQRIGFQFVDVKHCHGYLGHELLSAFTRPGAFGGSFENRTRFAREIISGIQAKCPGLMIGVRLSVFDWLPGHRGFGWTGQSIDLAEPIAFIQMLGKLGVKLINVTAGSPYYSPHVQRPAIFPPSDGYAPPEDPLVGVARQIEVTKQIKLACPESIIVGTGYTYLQEYLPHVAQAVVSQGWTDFVGLGRLVLSYWEMPADTLAGRAMQTKRICRTFSDCTSAPRNGLISGCYPLDEHYKRLPENEQLKQKKAEFRKKLSVIE